MCEAHPSGGSWRLSCCLSPAQADALSEEVQHEWSVGLQLAPHLLFGFQEQAEVRHSCTSVSRGCFLSCWLPVWFAVCLCNTQTAILL